MSGAHTAILWTNGMVMVFGPDGEQVTELQGRWPNVIAALLAMENVNWEFGHWRDHRMQVPRDTVEALARSCGWWPVAGPAKPVTTLGEFPELREYPLRIPAGEQLLCGIPDCPAPSTVHLPGPWHVTVRHLLMAIAGHRRKHHQAATS